MVYTQRHELLRVVGDALASRNQQNVIAGQFRSALGKCSGEDGDQLADQLHDLLSLLDAAHVTSGVQCCRS